MTATPTTLRTTQTRPAPWQDIPEIVEDVARLRDRFSADDLSVASILCDDHPADDIAFIAVDADLNVQNLTYGDLADRSKRLASALRSRGIQRGSRVGVLMGKTAQLPVVLLAIWRLGAVHIPLFTAFGGPAIQQRMTVANAQLIIADVDQHAKLEGIDVAVLAAGPEIDQLIEGHSPIESSEAIGSKGVFILLYTSGTTGTPKGVSVPVFAIAAFIAYMRYGLGVTRDDVFWNAADPGWAYGLYYAIVGPLATGTPNILLASGFSTEKTTRVIEELGVTNLAASPTVYRALKKDGMELRHRLRAASSAGEPLTPDVVAWAPSALGTIVRDHWGQTENGMGFANSWDARLPQEVKPGSMGQALPGYVGGILDTSIVISVEQSPLMWFQGYQDAPQQTRERFAGEGRWYLTGDVGRADGADFFFASRDDDVILAAGYRIAPFDIESILVADADVAEAAVVGRPDEIRGEVVEAFVILHGAAVPDDLEPRLQASVRNGYGAHAYPRRVHVVERLPKTPSGKVQRNILRAMADSDIDALRGTR